jgi:hypothetical protein
VLLVSLTLLKIIFHRFDSFQALCSVDAFQLDSYLPGVSTNSFLLVDSIENSFDVLHIHGVRLVEQTFLAKAPLL